VTLHPCYILHQRDYRETSKLLEVFSSEHGRVSLVAKGVKRKSFRNGHLLRINHKLDLAWSGRGDLYTLTNIESGYPALEILGRRLLSAFYVNELLVRLLHRHDAHPQLFRIYEHTLHALQSGENEERVLRCFEIELLKELGYGPVLDHAIDTGRKVEPGRDYHFQINQGPMEAAKPGKDSIPVAGNTLLALARGELESPEAIRQTKRIMRGIIAQHLGGKPLASRKMYQEYLHLAGSE
jgi:DNA repair protein RecO (recombination protein O)